MEYYSDVKRNEIVTHAGAGESLEDMMLVKEA